MEFFAKLNKLIIFAPSMKNQSNTNTFNIHYPMKKLFMSMAVALMLPISVLAQDVQLNVHPDQAKNVIPHLGRPRFEHPQCAGISQGCI